MWTIIQGHPEALPLVVGALRSVAEADGGPREDQRAWIAELARRNGGGVGLDEAPVPTAEALGRALPEADARRRLLRQLVLVALADQALSEAEVERVETWARALGVQHPAVAALRLHLRGRIRALAIQVSRRSFVASLFKAIWRQDGLPGLWRALVAAARVPSRTTAARYQALAELPEGTLGRELHDHCRRNGFAMPGERRGTPEILLFHDLGHTLTGFGTDGPGEVQMAGFEAGFMGGDDAFSITEFGMYAFGLGAHIIPNQPTKGGDFSALAFIEAYALGEHLDLDLRYWSPWPSIDRPMAQVRAELGLPAAA